MHLKVFVKLKKNPKSPLFWAKNPQKTQKNPKNPLGWVFKKKPGFFSNPAPMEIPLLSGSSVDIGVGLLDCDLYVINKLYVSIDKNTNKLKRAASSHQNF
jgi:hypothetical protein